MSIFSGGCKEAGFGLWVWAWPPPFTTSACKAGMAFTAGISCCDIIGDDSTLSLSELLEPDDDEDEEKETLALFGGRTPGSGVGLLLGLRGLISWDES